MIVDPNMNLFLISVFKCSVGNIKTPTNPFAVC